MLKPEITHNSNPWELRRDFGKMGGGRSSSDSCERDRRFLQVNRQDLRYGGHISPAQPEMNACSWLSVWSLWSGGGTLGAKILVILGQKGNTIQDNKGRHFLNTLLDRPRNKPVELNTYLLSWLKKICVSKCQD